LEKSELTILKETLDKIRDRIAEGEAHQKSGKPLSETQKKVDTNAEVAKELGISKSKVAEQNFVLTNATPEQKQAIEEKKTTIHKTYNKIKDKKSKPVIEPATEPEQPRSTFVYEIPDELKERRVLLLSAIQSVISFFNEFDLGEYMALHTYDELEWVHTKIILENLQKQIEKTIHNTQIFYEKSQEIDADRQYRADDPKSRNKMKEDIRKYRQRIKILGHAEVEDIKLKEQIESIKQVKEPTPLPSQIEQIIAEIHKPKSTKHPNSNVFSEGFSSDEPTSPQEQVK
jgi:hypothetical protein